MSFFALKVIALLSMLWDHISRVYPPVLVLLRLFPDMSAELFEGLHHSFNYVGRIAAPIFLFSIANGYRHTGSQKKYALRLLIFACLAEYPYFLLFEIRGNILFTLFFGLLTLNMMDLGNKKRPGLGYALAALAVVLSWHFAPFEGGGRYILFILIFYLTDSWPTGQKAVLWIALYPVSRWRLLMLGLSGEIPLSNFVLNGVGPLLGVGLTLFYNGKKGLHFPGDKYIWYAAYPLHLLILGLIRANMA